MRSPSQCTQGGQVRPAHSNEGLPGDATRAHLRRPAAEHEQAQDLLLGAVEGAEERQLARLLIERAQLPPRGSPPPPRPRRRRAPPAASHATAPRSLKHLSAVRRTTASRGRAGPPGKTPRLRPPCWPCCDPRRARGLVPRKALVSPRRPSMKRRRWEVVRLLVLALGPHEGGPSQQVCGHSCEMDR